MKAKSFIYILTPLMLSACATKADLSPAEQVDPMVGTGLHGHTYPGATVPFGAVQLSPDTRVGGWDAASGYHYDDNTIDGFSHTHLNGTGCTDLGDVLFRPTSSSPDITADTLYRPATFSHDRETAEPGYYSVKLTDEDILAELTATTRVGLHRYTFAEGKPAHIIIDLDHVLTDESVREASIVSESPTQLSGMRVTDGWVPDHHVYFTARFSKPAIKTELTPDGHKAVLTFKNDGSPLTAAVALSGVSAENAAANLDAEAAGLDFDSIRTQSTDRWNEALSAITVEGGTDLQRRTFYTSLYHTMLAPNTMSDINGQFRRNDQTIGTVAPGHAHYSTLSLWDTFRAWHPLMTIINPDLVCDMVNSMLDMYDATGELPVWPLASGETGCMIGYHSASVIADAYIKGIRCFDAEKALQAMMASSNKPRKGADINGRLGFIPSNEKRESVSCALEFGYDDWCIARLAQELGHDDIASEYFRRAANYANVFDGATGFFRGRRSDGNRERQFNPNTVSRDLTEATPWQYRFGVLHDVNGMINQYGGIERFESALDSIFVAPPVEGDLVDITGTIGQYAHGNEPSHHVAYLYNFIGKPWKTQEMTRRLLDEMYSPTPEGVCGNEDCGQMSAWYVLSSLGLYDMTPGSGELTLTTPLFDKAIIKLPGDTTLTITSNNPAANRYIAKVTLNGREITDNFVRYDELVKGGNLDFTLTDKPVKSRGNKIDAPAHSMTAEPGVAMPYIERDIYLFNDTINVEIKCATDDAVIRYTLDGTEPDENSPVYTLPIELDRTEVIKAVATRNGYQPSPVMTMTATKAVYSPAAKIRTGQQGVAYRYYEGICERTADITKGKLVERGILPEPGIGKAKSSDHFAFIFDGVIDVPEKGIYTFRTTTDDGSVLIIDGKTVVNNDGGHSAISATGLIPLEAGLHTFTLLYFEDYEGESFAWDWKLPGASEFTPIPADRLYTAQ